MGDAEYADLVRHVTDGELDYVIRSWDTVIAYRAHGAWHLSHAKHSVSTTKHMGKLYVLRMARCGYTGPDAR